MMKIYTSGFNILIYCNLFEFKINRFSFVKILKGIILLYIENFTKKINLTLFLI